jgi:cytochrome c oxidase cbb3-type subunit 2
MPAFPWLFEQSIDVSVTPEKLRTLQTLGVPYTDEDIAGASEAVMKNGQPAKEIDALVAYLQQLGLLLKYKR